METNNTGYTISRLYTCWATHLHEQACVKADTTKICSFPNQTQQSVYFSGWHRIKSKRLKILSYFQTSMKKNTTILNLINWLGRWMVDIGKKFMRERLFIENLWKQYFHCHSLFCGAQIPSSMLFFVAAKMYSNRLLQTKVDISINKWNTFLWFQQIKLFSYCTAKRKVLKCIYILLFVENVRTQMGRLLLVLP